MPPGAHLASANSVMTMQIQGLEAEFFMIIVAAGQLNAL